ncbi:MAG TPA: molybdopterin synthase catalytic subunit MoaE [Moraxellaceae bacterium]|nr:molybdopterin synthase catalytic subunit MoaE [Moraxellaceae bacterium]
MQAAPFDLAAEAAALEGEGVGAVVTFTGLVRNRSALGEVSAIDLEHYPGMTERALGAIVAEAEGRWPLQGVTLVHRVGHLPAGAPIVLVAVASAHREAAFAAAAFLMDYLKTRAPFWKKEWVAGAAHWVEAKASDAAAAARWQAPGVD